MRIIGTPRRRVDGRAKVTGQTKFADDIVFPRMLHCKLLRSTMPHARIVKVDVSRALARPGVHLVLTGQDFPVPYGILPVSQDEHALAVGRVRFVGDPVAAVIARDELTAFEALDFIDVEYEPLRTFNDPEESLAHPEPRIHEYGDSGNIHKAVSLRFGDVERALRDGDRAFFEEWIASSAEARARMLGYAYQTDARALNRVRIRVPDMPDLVNHTVTLKVYVTDSKGTTACNAGHLRIV